MSGLNNIKLKTFRDFLKHQGLKLIRTQGGHEIWARKDLLRPVVLQTHVDPIPRRIVGNLLDTMKSTAEEFENWRLS